MRGLADECMWFFYMVHRHKKEAFAYPKTVPHINALFYHRLINYYKSFSLNALKARNDMNWLGTVAIWLYVLSSPLTCNMNASGTSAISQCPDQEQRTWNCLHLKMRLACTFCINVTLQCTDRKQKGFALSLVGKSPLYFSHLCILTHSLPFSEAFISQLFRPKHPVGGSLWLSELLLPSVEYYYIPFENWISQSSLQSAWYTGKSQM